ncbi:MAG: DUF3017 domain-containing protein, partial [Motilibacteraceae bacterium]
SAPPDYVGGSGATAAPFPGPSVTPRHVAAPMPRGERPHVARPVGPAYLLVVAGVGVALGFAVIDRFRVCSAVLSLTLRGAAALRAVLPTRLAGLLAVRSRGLDVAALLALALGATLLTITVPRPR